MDLRVFFYRKFVAGQGRERSIAREFLEKNEKKVRKKHLLCYIENVGANIVRPPTWCSKAFPGRPCTWRAGTGEQCSPLQSFITAE